MQMLDQARQTRKIKKSQIILFGSFLIFIGIIILSWNYFLALRDEVYSDLKIDAVSEDNIIEYTEIEVPSVENIDDNTNITENTDEKNTNEPPPIDYDKYLGVLEIPKISLKRGFYDVNNRYNNIQYNVTISSASSLPDVEGGNLILYAHSGDAYISYFAYLYRLNVGDYAYVTYNKIKYTYQIVDIYDVPKVGKVKINRNREKTTLTLITCTKNNSNSQTVYIAEKV